MSLAIVVASLLLSPAVSQQKKPKPVTNGKNNLVILQSEGGSFSIEGPKGWIADRKVGRRLGVCCVYYAKGSYATAETILYPNIVTKAPGRATVQALMDSDLAAFRKNNPGMTYVDGDIPFNKRTAKLRYFHGVNQGSSEAVAYIDEDKIVALVVISSKTEKTLVDALPLLLEVLETYTYGVKAVSLN
ncbi:MAG: hypothetical protein ACRD20_17525 [Terriglobales bacterium]